MIGPRRISRVRGFIRIIHDAMTLNLVCHCLPLKRPFFERRPHCLRPLRTVNLSGKQCDPQVQRWSAIPQAVAHSGE